MFLCPYARQITLWKRDIARCIPVDAVAEFRQERLKLSGAAVDVADDVEGP
jgi:hypothetical protein